jgi:starvation-inducible DNA-binding protein
MTEYTIAGLDQERASKAADLLQQRLNALLDLQLTLKHIHWNLVGPGFIAVHEMLDPQVDAVRTMSDSVAERIATLGSIPHGTPGYLANHRTWDDYGLGKASVEEHLGALDRVFDGIIADHRRAMAELADLDPVSENAIVDQTEQLEHFQWLVRAHLNE